MESRFFSPWVLFLARVLFGITLTFTAHSQTCYEAFYSTFDSPYNDGFGLSCYENGVFVAYLKTRVLADVQGKTAVAATISDAKASLINSYLPIQCDGSSSTTIFTAFNDLGAAQYRVSSTTNYATVNLSTRDAPCPPPPECPEGYISDPNNEGACIFDCQAAASSQQNEVQTLLKKITTQDDINSSVSFNGCSMANTLQGSSIIYSDGVDTFIEADYQYVDFATDGTAVIGSTDMTNMIPLPEAPTYTETSAEVSRTIETLPDGSTYEVVTTVDQRTKETYVEYNQLTGSATIAGGDSYTLSTTTSTLTNPDGSGSITTTTQTDYSSPQQTTITPTATGGYTGITSGGASSGTTSTTTTTIDAAGRQTSSTTSTTGTGGASTSGVINSDSATPSEEEGTSYSGTAGTISAPSIPSEQADYTAATSGMMQRIQSAPIIQAATSVFSSSMASPLCPPLMLNLPYTGTIGTDIHCSIMQDFSFVFYPLMLALWSLAGVMLFLRA
jgi:hypothetical protein